MSGLVPAILVLAVGTFAFRVAGPLLRTRWTPSSALQATLEACSVVLLAAVAVRSGAFHDGAFAGPALLAGCAVAAILGWHRAPFLLTVGAAIAVTAALRLTGLD